MLEGCRNLKCSEFKVQNVGLQCVCERETCNKNKALLQEVKQGANGHSFVDMEMTQSGTTVTQ